MKLNISILSHISQKMVEILIKIISSISFITQCILSDSNHKMRRVKRIIKEMDMILDKKQYRKKVQCI